MGSTLHDEGTEEKNHLRKKYLQRSDHVLTKFKELCKSIKKELQLARDRYINEILDTSTLYKRHQNVFGRASEKAREKAICVSVNENQGFKTFMALNIDYYNQHRRTRRGTGGGAAAKKNLKLKSRANFEHKLDKNLRNKAIHLNERTKKGKPVGHPCFALWFCIIIGCLSVIDLQRGVFHKKLPRRMKFRGCNPVV